MYLFIDTPTYIILAAVVVSLTIVLLLRLFRLSQKRMLGIQLVSISAIWLSITLGGEFIFTWAQNGTCSRFLGCIDGFAGYDAFEHMFSGVVAALAILWLCERYPKYSILPREWWKAALIVVATVALIAVCWEILEYAHDTVELDIFHLHLINWHLHIDLLDQASNSDTMGDLTFALLGSILGLFSSIRKKARSLT